MNFSGERAIVAPKNRGLQKTVFCKQLSVCVNKVCLFLFLHIELKVLASELRDGSDVTDADYPLHFLVRISAMFYSITGRAAWGRIKNRNVQQLRVDLRIKFPFFRHISQDFKQQRAKAPLPKPYCSDPLFYSTHFHVNFDDTDQ